MEAVSCARLGLLTATGEFNAARDVAEALLRTAEERRLVRALTRGLALAIGLEHRAGDHRRARAHLLAYLRLFADTDYARPLAREREVALPLLDEVTRSKARDGAVAATASGLLKAMDTTPDTSASSQALLTEGEIDVLVRLERHRDKEIAEALGLSYDGLRYRVNRILRKLGARSRLDAVHRARAQGILPLEELPMGVES